MKVSNAVKPSNIRWMFVFLLLTLTPIAEAQWKATLGAQSQSMGHQALAFLPNEMWIHAGESVTWTSNVDEIRQFSNCWPGTTAVSGGLSRIYGHRLRHGRRIDLRDDSAVG